MKEVLDLPAIAGTAEDSRRYQQERCLDLAPGSNELAMWRLPAFSLFFCCFSIFVIEDKITKNSFKPQEFFRLSNTFSCIIFFRGSFPFSVSSFGATPATEWLRPRKRTATKPRTRWHPCWPRRQCNALCGAQMFSFLNIRWEGIFFFPL